MAAKTCPQMLRYAMLIQSIEFSYNLLANNKEKIDASKLNPKLFEKLDFFRRNVILKYVIINDKISE
jgi:hypothetical protein